MNKKRKIKHITALLLALIISTGNLSSVLAETTNISEDLTLTDGKTENDTELSYEEENNGPIIEKEPDNLNEGEIIASEEPDNPLDSNDDVPESQEHSDLLSTPEHILTETALQNLGIYSTSKDNLIHFDMPETYDGGGHSYNGECITVTNGGTYNIIGSQSITNIRLEIDTTEDTTLILNNIEISTNTNGAPISLNAGADVTIILPDNTVNLLSSSVNQYAGIRVPDNAKLTIDIPQDENGTGMLIAQGGFNETTMDIKGGAGIGGNHQEDCGEIIIQNGNITAFGVSGAAIGGGAGDAKGGGSLEYGSGGSGGIITISGGTVNAEVWQKKTSIYSNPFNGAAIGGGSGGDGGIITISGGTVNAKGRANGAAIGGGRGGIGGIITISGGTVEAENIVLNPNNDSESSNVAQGAAIGNGSLDNSSNPMGIRTKITISGDDTKVTANSRYSASIGGSSQYFKDSGNQGPFDILINGGYIQTKNYKGAAIGTGYVWLDSIDLYNTVVGNEDFTVTINDGHVIAISELGAGIGGSCVESYGSGTPTTAPSGGDITINGGTVTAQSQYSAGIGGGFGFGYRLTDGGSGGNITINGGTVAAQSEIGAGIGGGVGYYGGSGGDGGTIIISGDAEVIAESSALGSGIGGGGAYNTTSLNGHTTTANAGDGGNITISGSARVTAQSNDGAAIGGGGTYNTENYSGTGGNSGNIYIYGNAEVIAESAGGAGIGGGYSSTVGGGGGIVHIGGTSQVTATGGVYSSGIGGACGALLSTDTTHILDSSFGAPAVLTIEKNAAAYIFSQCGYALHTDNNEISGGAYIVNLYLWDGHDMDIFHNTEEIIIQGISDDKNHNVEIEIPAGYTSFAYTGIDSTYKLNTVEKPPRSIVYYESGSGDLSSSDVSTKAKSITFGISLPQTYTVTYDKNLGAGTVPQDNNIYTFGQNAVIMDNIGLTREGYIFSGWTKNPDGSGTIYSSGDLYSITENVTFYALWKEDSIPNPNPGPGPAPNKSSSSGGGNSKNQNTITFFMNEGSKDIYLTAAADMGSRAVRPPDPMHGGYIFTDWYLDENCTALYDFSSIVTKDLELFAGWEPIFTDEHLAYIAGYPDGTVRPDSNITRSEAAAIFYRLLNEDYKEDILIIPNNYIDVDHSAWYDEAVSAMTSIGAVNGYPDAAFRPDSNITRAEFAKIASSFSDEIYMGENLFSDIDNHWAAHYINSAAINGWISGYPGGIYKPDNYITRAEVIAIMNRILNRSPENTYNLLDSMIVWPDNMDVSKWYYLDIQEASNSHEYIRKDNDAEQWQTLYSSK